MTYEGDFGGPQAPLLRPTPPTPYPAQEKNAEGQKCKKRIGRVDIPVFGGFVSTVTSGRGVVLIQFSTRDEKN